MLRAIITYFSKPSPDRIRQEQMEEAQRDMLAALAQAEDHEAFAKGQRARAATLLARVKRLEKTK